jgi:hypothetical protein
MKAAVTVSDLGFNILGTLLVSLLGRRLCLVIGLLALFDLVPNFYLSVAFSASFFVLFSLVYSTLT